MEKMVVVRPGALGDVLAARSVLRWLKTAFPEYGVELLAPGERGAFLCRPGWADGVRDWERSAFAWLFSEGGGAPPSAVREAFSAARLVLAYMDFSGDAAGAERFAGRVRAAAPAASVFLEPSAPRAGTKTNILPWLLERAREAVVGSGLLPREALPETGPCLDARIPVVLAESLDDLPEKPYAVLHPGSGSARKNWPLENFAAIGKSFLRAGLAIVVTSGEADGDLGKRLAMSLPEAYHLDRPPLAVLAGVLAGAKAYVGNDSGVSHLAASVRSADGAYPCCTVVFGPTESAIWGPRGARILLAGPQWDKLTPEEAWAAVAPAAGSDQFSQ